MAKGHSTGFKPIARFKHEPQIKAYDMLDMLAIGAAKDLQARDQTIQASAITGYWSELIFANKQDFTAFNTSASEGSIISGTNEQPVIPALFWDGNRAWGRCVSILARGVLGSNGASQTIIWQVRLGTSSGSSSLSGTSAGVSATITAPTSASNQWWELRLDLCCYTPGIGSGNTTLSGAGYVSSPGGFVSPFVYPLNQRRRRLELGRLPSTIR